MSLLLDDWVATQPLRQRAPRFAGIAGLGVALPEQVVTNDDVGSSLGVDDAWIQRRTGIRTRRHVSPGQRFTDLAIDAARLALDDAAVDAGRLDLVIVASISQDELTPGAAPQVAAALGAKHAGAFDLGAACTGFVSGLSVATAFIESGRASRVLLVGGDVLSRNIDKTDRSTAILFGDGVGAIVLAAGGPGWIGSSVLGADGSAADLITISRDDALIRMNGHETFQHAVARMSESTLAACAGEGLALQDIDLFVYHQANARILTGIAESLSLRPERLVNAIADVGNTSAGSVPLALDAARRSGQLKQGSIVLVAAFGAGLTWGAVVLEWGRS